MKRRTSSALAFVKVVRQKHEYATWMDVADAYDAGLKHGVEAAKSAREALRKIASLRCEDDDEAGKSAMVEIARQSRATH